MKPKIISIIGGTGKMGTIFAEAFRKRGYEVVIAGRKTETTPIEAAKKGDVVIVTVPIRNTLETIKEIGPHVRKDALLTDFTSVKVNPCKAMKKYSKAEVIGGHPVFGPTVDLEGQTYVICPIRGNSYAKWYKEELESLGLKAVIMSPDNHDKIMSIVQCLNQLCNISFAKALGKLDFDIKSNKDLFSPAFMLKIYEVGRTISQDPTLYPDILTENPYSKQAAKAFLASLLELYDSIKKSDKNNLESSIGKIKEHFGDFTNESVKITNEMLKAIPRLVTTEKSAAKPNMGKEEMAILGPEYSYCHIVSMKSYPNSKFAFCYNIEEIFKKVSSGETKLGIAPIENMLQGSVRESVSALKKNKIKINKMFDLPIHHSLAAKSSKFSVIASHPQALGQCSNFISLMNKKIEETASTSAAMALASKNEEYAAIGSEEAAVHFGLKILQRDIENNHDNVTRFILISKSEDKEKKTDPRTSLLIVPHKDRPGLLFDMLKVFKDKNINLTKIESIPSGKKLGEYEFFIEIGGDESQKHISEAINTLKNENEVYSFGSYDIIRVV